jgi:hypothetical protein
MGGVTVSVERTNQNPVRGAVATQTTEAVSAASAGDLVRRDPLRAAAIQAESHGVVLDAQSREVMYQAVELSPRRVTRQAPAAAARRLKAYERPARGSETPTTDHADIEV